MVDFPPFHISIPTDAFEQTPAAFVKPVKIASAVVELVDIAPRLHEVRWRKRCIPVVGSLPQGSMGHVRARPRTGGAKTGPDEFLKFP
jgi:hypothetical protein